MNEQSFDFSLNVPPGRVPKNKDKEQKKFAFY